MKNIFKGILVGIALSEVYRILKRNGVLDHCKDKCDEYIQTQRRKRRYAERAQERK